MDLVTVNVTQNLDSPIKIDDLSINCSSPNKDICVQIQALVNADRTTSHRPNDRIVSQKPVNLVNALSNIRSSLIGLNDSDQKTFINHYFRHHAQSINPVIFTNLNELNEESSIIDFFLFNDRISLCDNWLSLVQNMRWLSVSNSSNKPSNRSILAPTQSQDFSISSNKSLVHANNGSSNPSNVAAFAALVQNHFVSNHRLTTLIRTLIVTNQSINASVTKSSNVDPIHSDETSNNQSTFRITEGMRDSCITALVNLPTLFANVAMTPSLIQSSNLSVNQWNKTLIDASLEVLFSPQTLINQSIDQSTVVVAQIVSKLTRLNHASEITDNMASILLSSSNRKNDSSSTDHPSHSDLSFQSVIERCQKLINHLLQLALEKFIASLVESLVKISPLVSQPVNQSVDKSIPPQKLSEPALTIMLMLFEDYIKPKSATLSSHIQYLFTNKFILNQSTNQSVDFGRLIVRFLFIVSYGLDDTANDACQSKLPLFDQSVNRLSQTWSSQSFVHNRSISQQQSVTVMLLEAIECLIDRADRWLTEHDDLYKERISQSISQRKEEDDRTMSGDRPSIHYPFSQHPLVISLMDGIQSRMNNNQPIIRSIGMRMAESMSRLIDPTRPLQFDEDDDETPEETKSTNHEVSIAHPISQSVSLSANQSIDPIWNDDDRDLRKVPLPMHIRDALDLMRKQEDREPIESAMLVMEALIRRRPVDLNDLAAEIVSSLQQAATTVWCESADIDRRRRLAMNAIVALCPLQTVPMLITSFYGQNNTLHGKLEILETLVAAAHELSGPKSVNKSTSQSTNQSIDQSTKQSTLKADMFSPMATSMQALAFDQSVNQSIDDLTQSLTIADHASIIARRVESRTRRWGKSTSQSINQSSVNTFAMIAHEFVFPLLHSIGRLADLLLLMNAIDAISILLSLAAPSSPHLESMVSSLLSVLMITRLHVDQSIRRISLVALIRIIASAPAHILYSCRSSLHEMSAWLVERQVRETDRDCINLSIIAQQEMKNRFESLQAREIDDIRRSIDAPRDLVIPGIGTTPATLNAKQFDQIKFM